MSIAVAEPGQLTLDEPVRRAHQAVYRRLRSVVCHPVPYRNACHEVA